MEWGRLLPGGKGLLSGELFVLLAQQFVSLSNAPEHSPGTELGLYWHPQMRHYLILH